VVLTRGISEGNLGIQFARRKKRRVGGKKKEEWREYREGEEGEKKRRREEKGIIRRGKCGLAGAKWDLNRAEKM